MVQFIFTVLTKAADVDSAEIASALRKFTPQTAVYQSTDGELLGLFALTESNQPVADLEAIQLAQKFQEKLDIRLYEALSEAKITSIPTAPGKHFLVFNGMTPDEGMEDEFRRWYAEEHIPMLTQVPGWRASMRFKLISALRDNGNATEYLALHEWESMDAFGTEAYKAATDTPWRTRVVVDGVHKKERFVFESKM
ncbi:hypothetical protein MKEN_01417900 [Mycena kentingensis (nom. inval.)]|nr:hypothetical protein MKEN_01417900 [Mycena kentingensis (nom. inval.)]